MLFRLRIIPVLILLFLITGCKQEPTQSVIEIAKSPVSPWIGTLQPYQTPTLRPTIKPPTVLPEIPVTPKPTSTPFLHQVKKGETMLGIAIKYGVALEDLQAANPDSDPRILSIGQSLVIPISNVQENPESLAATPTPVPIFISMPRCYDHEDSLACIVEIRNDTEINVESIRIGFSLFDSLGNIVANEATIPGLNRLIPGETTAVLVNFMRTQEREIPEKYIIRADILSALAIVDLDARRYANIPQNETHISLDSAKKKANVTGKIQYLESVSQIWLVGIVFDDADQPVGLRKVKLNTECVPVSSSQSGDATLDQEDGKVECSPKGFEMNIYSLGPEIKDVRIYSEAFR